jgi:hypothetical protein
LYPAQVHPEAREELRQARDYYRNIDQDLAVRILREHNTAMRYIRSFPRAPSTIFETYRHVVLPHFPYMIVYQVVDRTVNVVAFFFVSRDPGWMQRRLRAREPE